MKKLFTSIALCFVSVIAMSQSWNVLNREFNLGSSDVKYSDGNVAVPIYEQITTEKYGKTYVMGTVIKDYKYVQMPKSVFEEYKAGVTHVKVGSVFIGIGAALALAGTIMVYKSTNTRLYPLDSASRLNAAGYGLIGFGGAFVTVSIPLFAVGSVMKRQANWNYSLYNEILEHK